jgi:hypothetical protein
MNPTEQQIQERARQIGDRPYFPVPDDANSMYRTASSNGITIRFELMRTAMASIIPIEYGHNDWVIATSKVATELANALLLEMARQELGVTE